MSKQTVTIDPAPFSFDVDIPDPIPPVIPPMPKAEGESRVSQFNGDIYAAAADAYNGGELVIDRSVTLDPTKPLIIKECHVRGLGRGRNAPTIKGPVVLQGDWASLVDAKIEAPGKIALLVKGHNNGAERIRIQNSLQSMRVEQPAFYGHFSNISAQIGVQKGLSLATPASTASDDNGQFSFLGCQFTGGDYALKRDPAEVATMHRLLLARTQLSGGWSGDYVVDAMGMGEITLQTCDIEVSGQGPAQAMVRLGGNGSAMFNCPISFPSNAGAAVRTKKGIVINTAYGTKGTLVQNCGFNYAPADATCIYTNSSGMFLNNYVGIKANGATASAKLYDDGMSGWIAGPDVGLWVGGKKVV